MNARVVIGVLAAAVTGILLVLVDRQSADHVVAARFWFDRVTFQLPALASHGGPLAPAERAAVQATAWREIRAAFDGLRIEITDAPGGHYRVRVVQAFPARVGIGAMAAAESRSFGAFGGDGAIAFETVAGLAIDMAPAGSSRTDIIGGIGRGLGRVAAHELAHQILSRGDLHESTDPSSYDFGAANHMAQFYGPVHWGPAGPRLREALGLRATLASAQ